MLELGADGLLVFTGLVFVVPLANLLFDLLGDEVNRRVQVVLVILCKKVRAADAEPNGATKLPFRSARVVVLNRDASINRPPVQAGELLNLFDHMVFDGLGHGQIVRRENQLHIGNMMRRLWKKSSESLPGV